MVATTRRSSRGPQGRTVFVTVGTTQFDALISRLLSEDVLQLLASQGYTSVRLQVGRGAEPAVPARSPLMIDWYRFKNTLEDDMRDAALLISHAGAGSILEGMRLRALLLVVVNDALMHNHQTELADELQSRGHCYATTPAKLTTALEEIASAAAPLAPLPPADEQAFPRFLGARLGLA